MLSTKELEALKNARLRIKSGWCKQSVAKDEYGVNIGRKNVAQASQVCLAGGLYASGVPYKLPTESGYSDMEKNISEELMISVRELYPDLEIYSIRAFNDHNQVKLEDVLHVVEDTISRNSK